MSDNKETNPHSEATKWFLITLVGVILYVTASFGFVTNREIEPTDDQVADPTEAPESDEAHEAAHD